MSATSQAEPAEANQSSGFECNICLDPLKDPVVTLCGHLFCWSCIAEWIDRKRSQSDLSVECPVCKDAVVESEIVTIFGRGQSAATRPKRERRAIPPRQGFVSVGGLPFMQGVVWEGQLNNNDFIGRFLMFLGVLLALIVLRT